MKIERMGLLALGAGLSAAAMVRDRRADDRFERRQVNTVNLPPCDTTTLYSTVTPPQQTVVSTQNVTSYVPELATITVMPTYFTTVDLPLETTTITQNTTETDATTRTLVAVDYVTDTVNVTSTSTIDTTETDTITVPVTSTETDTATITDVSTVDVSTQPTVTETVTIFTQGSNNP
jgi:hypothetical protein